MNTSEAAKPIGRSVGLDPAVRDGCIEVSGIAREYDAIFRDTATDHIEQCLLQLNDLLTAAEKVQPGQCAHKVRRAREQLAKLATQPTDGPRPTLGLGLSPQSQASRTDEPLRFYRIANGVVEYKDEREGIYRRSQLYYGEFGSSEDIGDLRAWIAKRVLEMHGVGDVIVITQQQHDVVVDWLRRMLPCR